MSGLQHHTDGMEKGTGLGAVLSAGVMLPGSLLFTLRSHGCLSWSASLGLRVLGLWFLPCWPMSERLLHEGVLGVSVDN